MSFSYEHFSFLCLRSYSESQNVLGKSIYLTPFPKKSWEKIIYQKYIIFLKEVSKNKESNMEIIHSEVFETYCFKTVYLEQQQDREISEGVAVLILTV